MNYSDAKAKVWSLKKTNREIFHSNYNSDMKELEKYNENLILQSGLRIMTYNVHFWMNAEEKEVNFNKVVELIKRLSPDIICFQEILIPDLGKKEVHSDKFSIEDVYTPLGNIGYKYRVSFRASKYKCKINTSFGNSIYSKNPIYDTKGLTLKTTIKSNNKCCLLAKIKYQNSYIWIGSVHLDVHDTSGRVRQQQIKNLLSRIQDISLPLLICGDFNCLKEDDYNSEQKEWLKNNSIGNPDFESITLMNEFEELFPFLNYTCWTGRRTDYMFVRNFSFSIKNRSVYYTNTSDHLPLILDIE